MIWNRNPYFILSTIKDSVENKHLDHREVFFHISKEFFQL